jgi:hypothetical protein
MDDFLENPLRRAIEFLEKHQLRYAIIGGLALAQWNFIRATKDVDIKVLVSDLDYASVRRAILTAFPDRARLNAPDNPFIVAVNIEGVIVDFLLTLPGYEEQLIEHALERDLGGWSAWICTAEDLIIQKVSAGRPKDWIDVEELLIARHGKLDYAYIEDWLSQFAEALENPELLAKYHQIRGQVESLRNSA